MNSDTNTNTNTNTNTHTHTHTHNTSSSAAVPSSSRPSSSSSSTTQACAACKYQRRKCNPDCTLAPYFPAEHQRQFLNAHRLFGVSNILKIIRDLDPRSRSEAMKSIIFQSNMRASDPVGGCYRIILDLERQYEHDCHELAIVLHQLALCRQAAAAAPAQVQDQLPNLLMGDADQLNAMNTADNAIYENNLMAQQQQQQQQYFDYLYFDGSGSGGGENNIENDDDHINIHINSNTTISGNSVNNNNVGVNGNGANVVDMAELPQSMFSLQAAQEEDDVKPLIDMFDVTHALPIGEEEVGEITSKAADLDLTAGSYHCSVEIQMKKEESNPMEHVQEHDLKGAASLFTLTSCNSSYV